MSHHVRARKTKVLLCCCAVQIMLCARMLQNLYQLVEGLVVQTEYDSNHPFTEVNIFITCIQAHVEIFNM